VSLVLNSTLSLPLKHIPNPTRLNVRVCTLKLYNITPEGLLHLSKIKKQLATVRRMIKSVKMK
jgi:hypothetical protein